MNQRLVAPATARLDGWALNYFGGANISNTGRSAGLQPA
jgi:hypothetical protein